MKNIFKRNAIHYAIAFVGAVMILSVVLSFYNRHVMQQTTLLKAQAAGIMMHSQATFDRISDIDKGLRGYALTKHKSYLGHYQNAINGNRLAFDSLEACLRVQRVKLPASAQSIDSLTAHTHEVKQALNQYIAFCDTLMMLADQDSMAQLRTLLNLDKGMYAWKNWDTFHARLCRFEVGLSQTAQAQYQSAVDGNTWLQVFVLLIAFPTLGWVVYRLHQESESRYRLLLELDRNNRQYLFDSGTEVNVQDPTAVVGYSIQSFQRAATFVQQVASGQYNVDWEGLSDDNRLLNEKNLVGELMKMRQQMKHSKAEDEKRLWVTEGQAQFSDIIRKHQQDLATLTYEALRFLVKYLHAQQGSLFVIKSGEEGDWLELSACYAFERRKHLQKRLALGEGLIGQACLEGLSTMLTELPPNYTYISSGLGDATPGCLLIVPMKNNSQVQAVVEIASFETYETYQIEFLEKVGEFIASAIAAVNVTEKTAALLEQFRVQTDQLRQQEEELRQNMEELEATQENMRRSSRELDTPLNTPVPSLPDHTD